MLSHFKYILPWLLLFIMLISSSISRAQIIKKFNISLNYGISGNYFVRDYNESSQPLNSIYLFKKKYLGTISGIELSYNLSNNNTLNFGYSRSINKEQKNYYGDINGVEVFINNFSIRHINNYFILGLQREIFKSNPNFELEFGVLLLGMNQQEISLIPLNNFILIEERNFNNSRLIEGGAYAGLYLKKIVSSKFGIGLKFRAYYLISTRSFEALTLTPNIVFSF